MGPELLLLNGDMIGKGKSPLPIDFILGFLGWLARLELKHVFPPCTEVNKALSLIPGQTISPFLAQYCLLL